MHKRTILIGSMIIAMAACSGEGHSPLADGNRSEISAPTASPYLMGRKAPAASAAENGIKQSTPHETGLMHEIGLQVTDGKIIIDTGKSKRFFENLERKIHKSMQKSVEKIEKHSPSAADLGIHVQKDRITVDLNQTADFIKEWGETIKVLGEELDRSLAPAHP